MIALAAAMVVVRPTCAPSTRDVLRLAPAMAPELARHLARDDDAAFRQYCHGVGPLDLRGAITWLVDGLDSRSADRYARSWRRAAPHIERLSWALAREFDCPEYLWSYCYRAALTPDVLWQVRRAEIEEDSMYVSVVRLSREQQAAWRWRLTARFAALGDERDAYLVEAGLADCAASMPGRIAWLEWAVAHGKALGETYMTCQYEGGLGAAYLDLGQQDRAFAHYDETLRSALRHHFSDQAGRILMFYARDYLRQGRVAVALAFARESQGAFVAFGSRTAELRYLIDANTVFSMLECWEVVERLLDRGDVLMRELADRLPANDQPLYRQHLLRQRAQMLMARGDVEPAESILGGLVRVDGMRDMRIVSEALNNWSQGLAEAGLWERSLTVIDRAIAMRDSGQIGLAPLVLLRRVEVLESLGRYDEAARALEELDRRRRDWRLDRRLPILRDVAVARLAAATGDSVRARAALRKALDRLHDQALSGDTSTGTQLALASFDDLRLAAHEILATDPERGYRLEMEWRAMSSQAGRGRTEVADRPWGGASGLPPPGVVHCVYLPLRTSTVRWIATSSGVSRDTLPLAREQARERVRQVLDRIAKAGGGPFAGPDAATLRDLATLLLPAEVLETGAAGPIRTLCVSADGPLAALPFETLNLSPGGGYEPLALRWDVARIRSLATRRHAPAEGPPSIVADPTIAPPVRRRFVIAAHLDQAVAEAHLAAGMWPGARILTGADAQKPAVLEAWGRAPRILLAAHLVREPDIPFLGFIPLAPADTGNVAVPADPGLDQKDMLDPADVRALDLSGCGLAVLSSCASGAPDLSAKRVAPSFAEAFLDAGARTVIQTMWPVEDHQARMFASGFLRATTERGIDPIRALGDARRAAWGRGAAPSVWAAWSVGVLDFPRAARPRTLPVAGAGGIGAATGPMGPKLDRSRTELCENPHPIPRGAPY